MGCIYRIVCHATGRSYIGQTSYSNPFSRYQEQQRSAKSGSMYSLHVAMREHDTAAFECECICVVPNKSLNELECYYAEQYDAYTWAGGYNEVECGMAILRREVSDTTRQWMKRRAVWKNMHRRE